MREVKFRVRNVETKKVIGFDYIHEETGRWLHKYVDDKNGGTNFGCCICEHGTIKEQYTGFHDKNGEVIYENDILYNKDSIPYEYYQVKDMFELYHYDWEQIIEVELSEIIGDIYQNPELLK